MRIETAMTRPVTTSGQSIRLGTASMQYAPPFQDSQPKIRSLKPEPRNPKRFRVLGSLHALDPPPEVPKPSACDWC